MQNKTKEKFDIAELPGNIHEKIGDLRIEKDLTKKQVCEDLGLSASQLTRIENEEIKSIGHDLVVKFADYFDVSADYLLGRTNIRFRKNVELDELDLSHKALCILQAGKVNTQLLSRIIEHRYFMSLTDYAESYFSVSHDAGLMTRNELIGLAVSDLSEYLQSHPSAETEARKDIRQLKAQKISGSEADLEKLNSIFIAILKDVKKQYAQTTPDISTDEMLERIREMHQLALQKNQEKKLDEKDMAELTAQLIVPLGLSEKNIAAFKKLMEKILKNSL